MLKRIFRFYSLNMYILVRPFDGFYNMKHLNKGTVRMALLNFFLVCLSVAIMNQYTSVRIVDAHPAAGNSIMVFTTNIMALVLFCVSNWAVSTITNGEGRFKDIVMAVCYAMTPIVLTFIPVTILSNFLAYGESGFYFMIVYFAMGYSVLLGFLGLVSVHNYSPSKAIITIFLTVVAVLVIVFLMALLVSMVQLLVMFLRSVYTELILRV